MEASPRDNEGTAVDGAPRRGRKRNRGGEPAGTEDHAEGRPLLGRQAHSGGVAEPEPADPRPHPADAADRQAGAAPDARDADVPEEESHAESEDEDVSDIEDTGATERPPQAPLEAQELRPQRKFRVWQLAPVVVLGALGSLMFAFPLAFEPGGGSGAVVSMLGLLICGCAAGWGIMAARRVGQTWPGLPPRGSGRRPDWRVATLYAVLVAVVVALAIWRVARLRH